MSRDMVVIRLPMAAAEALSDAQPGDAVVWLPASPKRKRCKRVRSGLSP